MPGTAMASSCRCDKPFVQAACAYNFLLGSVSVACNQGRGMLTNWIAGDPPAAWLVSFSVSTWPLLQIETYFNKTVQLATYWIGLTKLGNIYTWYDQTTIGTGTTSNGNPYGRCQRRANRVPDQLAGKRHAASSRHWHSGHARLVAVRPATQPILSPNPAQPQHTSPGTSSRRCRPPRPTTAPRRCPRSCSPTTRATAATHSCHPRPST